MYIFNGDAYVKEEYRRRRKRQQVLTVLLLPIVFYVLYQRHDAPANQSPTLMVFSVVAVLAALVFSISNWRCPSCDKYLGRSLSRKDCSSCGADFRD